MAGFAPPNKLRCAGHRSIPDPAEQSRRALIRAVSIQGGSRDRAQLTRVPTLPNLLPESVSDVDRISNHRHRALAVGPVATAGRSVCDPLEG